jgi:hypothetical protein
VAYDLAESHSPCTPTHKWESTRGKFPHQVLLNILDSSPAIYFYLLHHIQTTIRSRKLESQRLPIRQLSRISIPAHSRILRKSILRYIDSINDEVSQSGISTDRFLTCTDQRQRFPPFLVPTTYHGDGLVIFFSAFDLRRVRPFSFHF